MIHSVICTDNGPNVHWQSELLEYSWSRVNQQGEIVRLVSCDLDTESPLHKYARVIRTEPTSIHPESGDHYLPYNRLFSFRQWLDEYQPEGTVLILDPDCVFRKPLNIEVKDGLPIGQHWQDFGISDSFRGAMEGLSDVDIDSLPPLTWPALITCGDLRRIIDRWIELTAGIRNKTAGWESDMFAFVVACQEHALHFELQNNTAWTPWPDAKVENASLVHYCQKIYNSTGEEIWWKQAYKPWDRLPTTDAKEPYCSDLLRLVDEFASIRQFETTLSDEDTIFVAIAAYCEPELVSTIESCLTRARHPGRLRFGICLQFDESDPLTGSGCLDRYSRDLRFRYVKYPYTASRGGCWARNIAQQLYENERFTLQIDAHTQMLESWDVILIKMLRELPANKPLITGFPPLYTLDNGVKTFHRIEDLSQVNTAYLNRWNADGGIHHPQKVIPENNRRFPRRTRFLSGAFVFTLGQWNNEVRQDPGHFYTGEEFALTIRSFTHGYDLFDPSQIVAWHRLHPEPNRKFMHDNDPERVQQFHEAALERLRWLYQGDPEKRLGRYGPGTARDLNDFRIYSGLDCSTLESHPDAVNGIPPDPVTLMEQYASAISNDVESAVLELRIHLRNMPPLELVCEESNPVLRCLFESHMDKRQDPDGVVYLNMGDRGDQVIHFRKSSLIAIETDPPLSEDFLASLGQGSASADSHHPAGQAEGHVFPDEWKYWIWHSIHVRGCSRDVVFKELVLRDFPWDAIRNELNWEPSIPLEHIVTFSEQPRANNDRLLIPNIRKVSSSRIEMYSVNDFLDPRECRELMEEIRSRHQPSETAMGERTPEIRTNRTCFFGRNDEQCPLANEVTIRIARLLGINPSYAEALQGHIYTPGQEYKPHADYFEPGTDTFDKHANDELGGQRTWSVLVYLNDVEEGGSTEFTAAGLSIVPRQGKLVAWNNLLPSGTPNHYTAHQGKPPRSGDKMLLTQWFRSLGDGEMYQRDPQEYIQAYTSTGFQKAAIPADLMDALRAALASVPGEEGMSEHGHCLVSRDENAPSVLLPIPDALKQRLFVELAPICEQWCGKKLLPSTIYGIRRYHEGTTLGVHRDRPKTHIISAILNIAQDVDEEWPLEIEDHGYRRHQVFLTPGEMLLYEGGRLPHGRPTPLVGRSFHNIFVHFRPIDYILPEVILQQSSQ